MPISTQRGSRVNVVAEHWPSWTDDFRWSPTISGHLVDIPIGQTEVINGRVVARWSGDEYEVVTYGRRIVDRETAFLLISG